MENETRRPSEPVVLPQLTAKQREVMALIADHRTSKEIAGLLGISESAVNQRIEQIRARLGGVPRGEMARLYRQEFARERALAATFPPTWKKNTGSFGAQHWPRGGCGGSIRCFHSCPTDRFGGCRTRVATFPRVSPGQAWWSWPGRLHRQLVAPLADRRAGCPGHRAGRDRDRGARRAGRWLVAFRTACPARLNR